MTKAFDVAYNNIRAFHEAQRGTDISVETMPGVTCRRVTRPINAVGVYVPGGTAVLPSSALMLAVPAQIAGKRGVVACQQQQHVAHCNTDDWLSKQAAARAEATAAEAHNWAHLLSRCSPAQATTPAAHHHLANSQQV